MEGVNSSRVSLKWDFTPSSNYILSFYRQKLGGIQVIQIAVRTGTLSGDVPFVLVDLSFETKYEAKLPATLVLKNVTRNAEYKYIITVQTDRGVEKLIDQVTIDVVGE